MNNIKYMFQYQKESLDSIIKSLSQNPPVDKTKQIGELEGLKPCSYCDGTGTLHIQDGPDDTRPEECHYCEGEGFEIKDGLLLYDRWQLRMQHGIDN